MPDLPRWATWAILAIVLISAVVIVAEQNNRGPSYYFSDAAPAIENTEADR